jgi:hypothetical protein
MSRPHAAIELRAWALLAVPNGLVAGAVVGVVVTALFSATVPSWALALGVGLVTGAGPLANVSSLLWSRWSRGRDKIGSLLVLQGLFAAALFAVALAPVSVLGLIVLVAAVIAARVAWCGVITLRAVVWRANFGRYARTAFVARSQVVVALVSAAVAAGAGLVLDREPEAFRWIYLAAGGVAIVGLAVFSRMRIRRHRQLRAAEQAAARQDTAIMHSVWQILSGDEDYRRYLAWLFVLGSGTLMGTAPLILVLAQQFELPKLTQVLLTASVPTLMIPLTTPLWARLLAREHAIKYRATNSYACVAAAATALAGATSGWIPLLWLAAALQGSAFAGGMLVWALAHNDFAPAGHSAEYLGIHVTLAGVRGLLAPLLGAGLYSGLEAVAPGLGPWSLAAPLALVALGALGFTRLKQRAARTVGA